MASGISTSELNMRCAGVKRLLKEASELSVPNNLIHAQPMEDNLFEWHFTIRGPPDTVYENGVYHGRIILPADYPMKPPSVILLTPNGRFETNKKICLSISGHHPETWLPSWSIRTALLALIGFMPTHSKGALGGLDCGDTERRRLAAKSLDWRCSTCGCNMHDILPLMHESSNTNASASNAVPKADEYSAPNSSPSACSSDPIAVPNIVTNPVEKKPSIDSAAEVLMNDAAIETVAVDGAVADKPAGDPTLSSKSNWPILFYIFLLSAVFFALLIRRLSFHA